MLHRETKTSSGDGEEWRAGTPVRRLMGAYLTLFGVAGDQSLILQSQYSVQGGSK